MIFRIVAGFMVLSSLANSVFSQGLLVPHDVHHHHWRLPRPTIRRPPRVETSYTIKEIAVKSRIQGQVARTQVTQRFVNTGSRQIEASFVFPLPYDGAVDRLTFLVDGKEYEAQLLSKERAREIYEGYVRRNKDPALLEWMGTGLFKTSVFPIPPGAERSVTLRYTQVLRKQNQLTDYLFPLSTAKYTSQPIETLSFHVSIESESDIKSVYSPTHDVRIRREGDRVATLSYETKNVIPSNDFRLFYDTAKSELGASLLSYWPSDEDHGYFMLLASPNVGTDRVDAQRKSTILVLDRSGSMSGKKIEQAREAVKYVVNNLNDGDLFNIVAYDSEIESFRPELQRYNEATREQAIGFINGIFAGGSTNISEALSTALGFVQDSSLPNYIVFLTDGKPTAGLRNESEIVSGAERANKHGARLVSFGVGYDVNSRLIDRLSRANRGQSEYVRPDEDIEAHVSRLYQNISAPVMTAVEASLDIEGSGEHGSPVNRVYPRQIHDIFAGQQVTMVGRYSRSGAAKIKFAGKVGVEQKMFRFPATFAQKSGSSQYAFVAKIWAARRIGQIIDQLDLEGRNQELITELVSLSTKHGIITPYTSFLADDQASPEEFADRSRGLHIATDSLESLDQTAGRRGFGLRLSKKAFQEAQRLPEADAARLVEQLSTAPARPGNAVRSAPIAAGGVAVPAVDGTVRLTDAVIHVGDATIYRRGNMLVVANAADVNLEKEREEITEISRFSGDYFALIANNTKTENAVFARQGRDQQMLIRLRGRVYLINSR